MKIYINFYLKNNILCIVINLAYPWVYELNFLVVGRVEHTNFYKIT